MSSLVWPLAARLTVLPDWVDFQFFQPNVIKSSAIGWENQPNLATVTANPNSQDDSEGCYFVFRSPCSTVSVR